MFFKKNKALLFLILPFALPAQAGVAPTIAHRRRPSYLLNTLSSFCKCYPYAQYSMKLRSGWGGLTLPASSKTLLPVCHLIDHLLIPGCSANISSRPISSFPFPRYPCELLRPQYYLFFYFFTHNFLKPNNPLNEV